MSLAVKSARYSVRAGSGLPMGDPGLFGFLGGVAKTLVQNVPGPVGIGARALASRLGNKNKSAMRPTRSPVATPFGATRSSMMTAPPVAPSRAMPGVGLTSPTPVVPVPGIRGAVQRTLPFGQTGYQPATQAQMAASANGKGGPKGYRLNKTGYFLKKTGEWVEPGTRWVKIRRRNPGNSRSVSRAIDLIQMAKNRQSNINRITIRKKCPK